MVEPTRGPGYSTGHFIYLDDRGTRYSVSIGRRFGDNPALGFDSDESRSTDARLLPGSGFKMRHVNVVNHETGLRRSLPVGRVNAPILTSLSIDLLEPRLGKTLTYRVSSYVGEHRRGLA